MSSNTPHHLANEGESIMEIILAVAIFAIVLPAILYTVGSMVGSEPQRNSYFDSLIVAEEVKTVVQQVKSADWNSISTDGAYEATYSGSAVKLTPLSGTPTPGVDGFTRVVHIGSVQRNGEHIVETGGETDPATKKVIIEIGWKTSQPVTTDFYITRSDLIKTLSIATRDDFMGGVYRGTVITPLPTSSMQALTINGTEPEPDVGLRSWWKMSGEFSSSSAEIDMAPEGVSNLRIVGNPSFSPARFGNKVSLSNESQLLVASSSASLEFSGQISVMTWIKTTHNPGINTILSKIGSPLNGYSLLLRDGMAESSVGNGTEHIIAKASDNVITDGLWHHVGMTYDGFSLQTWVDGSQVGTAVGVGLLNPNTSPIYIGASPSIAESGFVGDIDDVQVYSTALTKAEINNLLFATYTSTTYDIGEGLLHSIGGTVYQPQNTKVALQIAMADPPDKDCDNASYVFVGPDKTSQSFFSGDEVGTSSIFSVVPTSVEDGYSNPGQCLRWRAFLYSANDLNQEKPFLTNIRLTYSK